MLIMMKNITNKLLLGLMAVLFLAPLLVAFSLPAVAQSTPSASWVDNFNISFEGNIYQSDDHDNTTWVFYRVDDPDGCPDVINDISWDVPRGGDRIDDPSDDDTTAQYQEVQSSNGGCADIFSKVDLNLTNPSNATVSLAWDMEYVISTDADAMVFQHTDRTGLYERVDPGEDRCVDWIEISTGDSSGVLTISTPERAINNLSSPSAKTREIQREIEGFASVSLFDRGRDADNCYESEAISLEVSRVENSTEPGTGGSVTTVATLATEEPQSCESEGGDFSFIICPLLQQSNKAISWLDEQIIGLLFVNEEYYQNGTQGGERIEDVWIRMRNIGYIILIPIMLVMVTGTALGFKGIDAYTVKRALPRMFAAIIFMAISLDVTRLMVDITNDLGVGAAGLVAAPFSPDGIDGLQLTDIFSANAGTDVGVLGGGVIAGVAAFSVVSLGVIGSYLLVSVLALLVVFFVLSIRQMILIFLMVLSPLAIIAWIFPGNDKPWKIWWQSFSKLLLLFPLIMALLMFGRGFALIVQSTDGGGVVTTLLKLTAFIGPFFFIPSAFKYAGGAFANIAGMVNDKGKGVFDRQKKWRGEKMKKNWNDTRTGNRLKGSGKWTDRINKGYEFGSNADKAFTTGVMKPGNYRQNIRNAISDHEHATLGKVKEENSAAAAIFKDDVTTGASIEDTAEQIDAALLDSGDQRFQNADTRKAAVARIMSAKRASGKETYEKAAIQALAESGTYYRDAAHLAQHVNKVYGDDRQGAGSALMAASAASMSAGRVDLGGASAGSKLRTLQALHDGYTLEERKNAVTGELILDADGNKTYNQKDFGATELNSIVNRDVIDSQAASTIGHASMKPGYVEDNLIPEFQNRIKEAYTSGDPILIEREMATVANMYDTLSQTNPQLGNIFADQVMSMGVPSDHTNETETRQAYLPPGVQGPEPPKTKTVMQQIEGLRTNDEFRNRRREYGSATEEERGARARGDQPPDPGAGAATGLPQR
jgi:hypothetical protein